ncbi:MAG: S-layer homology domain-containing protein [bacterium]
MFIRLFLCIYILLLCHFVHAFKINDLNSSDPAYNAVKSSIDNGYLSLYKNRTFQGKRPVTRKEMAILIERLLTRKENSTLDSDKIQDLSHLSENFKPLLSNLQEEYDLLQGLFFGIQEENIALHRDVSVLQDKHRSQELKLKRQQLWIYALCGFSMLNLFL